MKRFSVVESVRHLTEQYRSFILSSYRLADPKLRAQFEEHVNRADVMVKGPYVTLARDFAPGRPLADLLAAGIGHQGLARLHWPFGEHALFTHQEQALATVENGRNVIVKTGTGSGKTEAFLLPVLADVLCQREQGVQGTKAILLYPMNALANDQLGRLRELIRDTGSPITFALYTGDSETVSAALGEPLEGNELTRREQIRQSPPDGYKKDKRPFPHGSTVNSQVTKGHAPCHHPEILSLSVLVLEKPPLPPLPSGPSQPAGQPIPCHAPLGDSIRCRTGTVASAE